MGCGHAADASQTAVRNRSIKGAVSNAVKAVLRWLLRHPGGGQGLGDSRGDNRLQSKRSSSASDTLIGRSAFLRFGSELSLTSAELVAPAALHAASAIPLERNQLVAMPGELLQDRGHPQRHSCRSQADRSVSFTSATTRLIVLLSSARPACPDYLGPLPRGGTSSDNAVSRESDFGCRGSTLVSDAVS